MKSDNWYLEQVNTLNSWSTHYYNGNPIATDAEYDALYREVVGYEKEHPDEVVEDSPTLHIGSLPISSFNKTEHGNKLLSLADIFTEEEASDWVSKLPQAALDGIFLFEPKYDGASVNLRYKNGELVDAITRGDGLIGDSVLANILTIKNFPKSLSKKIDIEIRGEVTMSKKAFLKIKYEHSLDKFTNGLSNPRNAAAGSIRTKNPMITAKRQLSFHPHGYYSDTVNFTSLTEYYDFLESEGFKVIYFSDTINTLNDYYAKFVAERNSYQTDLDGMVVKVNDIDIQRELGNGVKYPKWAFAYKFPAKEMTTTLVGVNWQVGRTGVLTPVGEITPVKIGDVMVQFVKLDLNFINANDLRINDAVVIIRSGDVIPKLTNVFTSRRNDNTVPIQIPKYCPVCGSEIEIIVNTYKCVNPKCDARIVNRILNAVSRKGLNIDGIGEAVIMLLVKEKLVNNIMDIFKLPELYNNGDIKISIPNIKNIIRNIINCQRVKLAKFIYALGIESIGEVTAQWLADTYGEEVFNLNEDQLKNQNNPLAGPEMIKHYISGIKMLEREISDLKSVLHIEMDKSTSNGVTYLITGKLYDHNKEQVPRELIISKLNSLGYVNTSTPSKAKIAILGTDHSLKKRNELKDGIKIIWAVDRDIFKIIAEL